MTCVHNFVVDLAKAGKAAKDIKDLMDKVHGPKAMSLSQMFHILSDVKAGRDASDKRANNGHRKVRAHDFIKAVNKIIKMDRQVTLEELASDFDTSTTTIYHVLKDDLCLSKKAARWVPKQLSAVHGKKRLRCVRAFEKAYSQQEEAFRNSIVTTEETNVSFFTPERKSQSRR